MLSRICLVSFLLTSCGSSGGSGGGGSKEKVGEYAVTVQSDSDLPTCDDGHEGALAYVLEDEIFKYCSKEEWSEIDLKGKDGEDGENGAKGTDGADGQDGSDNRIVSSLRCAGTLTQATAAASNLTVPAVGLYIEYEARLTEIGDVFSEASISSGAIQTSGMSMYSVNQVGSTTAPVTITDDYYGSADQGYWTLSLNRTTLVTTAEYFDAALPTSSTRTFTFAASVCTVQENL